MKIGIDYSLSSPGVCVNTSEGEFKYEDCNFYYLTSTKKYDSTFKDKIAFGQSTVDIKALNISCTQVNLRDITTSPIGLLIS